jgi:hypothetical protein
MRTINMMILAGRVVLASIFLLPSLLRAQNEGGPLDSVLARKITVSGICLCRTALSDLRQDNKDLA